jgi:putative flippase GtrA
MKKFKGLLSFLKFAGLSGLGWLIDISIFLTLISAFNLEPFQANTVSSCIAALGVFLLSRELIFRKASKALFLRLMVYLTYTLIVIVVVSTIIGISVSFIRPLTENIIGEWSIIVIAGISKILLTPPQLVLNYYMSRFLSERKFIS